LAIYTKFCTGSNKRLKILKASMVLTLFIVFSVLLFITERIILFHLFEKGLVLDTLEEQLVAFYNLFVFGILLHFLILFFISFGGYFYFSRFAALNEEVTKEIRLGFIYSSIFVVLMGVFYATALLN